MGVPEGADAAGFACPGVLAVLGLEAAAPGECELTRLLQDKLQYEMRLQYMVTPALGGGGAHGALQGRDLHQGGHGGGQHPLLYSGWVLDAVFFTRDTLCQIVPELFLLGAHHIKGLLHLFPGVMLSLARMCPLLCPLAAPVLFLAFPETLLSY